MLLSILEKGGPLTLAAMCAWWSYTLWVRLKEKDALLESKNSTCLACSQNYADRLLELGNGTVKALEHSTEAIEANQRQAEIIKKLEEMHGDDRRKSRPI